MSPLFKTWSAPTLFVLIASVPLAVAQPQGNIAVDQAARLVQGVNASIQYQLYQPNQNNTPPAVSVLTAGQVDPQKIDIAMAPVLGAIKNGLLAGVATTNLVALHQAAVSNALTVTTNLSPMEQITTMIDFISDSIDPADWPKLGLDLVKAELTAYHNLNTTSQPPAPELSAGDVLIPLQPDTSAVVGNAAASVQQQVDDYYLSQMAEAYDIAASNSSFAQTFDQIFQGDLHASITSNATTILNSNLNIPNYFKASANADGSLTVDVAGLQNVYLAQSQILLSQDTTAALTLASQINAAQLPLFLSGASESQIQQSPDAATIAASQALYKSINQDITVAKGGILLAANLYGFFDKATQTELTTYGNAAVQFTTGVNELLNGMTSSPSGGVQALGLAGAVTATGNVVGAVLSIYNFLQGPAPPPNAAVLAQLATLGKQITQLQAQMNQRFNVVDQNLNTIYQAINSSFTIVITNLNTLIQQLSNLQSNLNQFEQNIYSLEIEGFLSNLNTNINGCIAYQQNNPNLGPLPITQYAGPNGCENVFYTWGNYLNGNAITLATIPGNRLYDDGNVYQQLLQPPTGNSDLDNFVDSANINYFSQYPFQRFQLPALASSPLANPSVWEIAAQAYVQLRRENPAYYTNPGRLSDIITEGNQIQAALANIRSKSGAGHPLFDSLFANYTGALSYLQVAITNFQNGDNNAAMTNWAAQGLSTVVAKGITRCDGGTFQNGSSQTTAIPADNTLIGLVYPAYLAAQAVGIGSLRTCLDAQWVNVHYGSYPDPLANIQITVRFKYTPQGQSEQEILQVIGYTQDCCQTYYLNGSFLPPHDTVSLYGDVWYYWQMPFGPPFRPGIDGYWMDKLATYGTQNGENNQLIAPLQIQLSISNNTNGHVINQFAVTNSAIQNAANRLAGTKAILQKFILIGLPRSTRSSDYLRSLLYGSQGLPGRTVGPGGSVDDIIGIIKQQASQGAIDIQSVVSPRVNLLQGKVNSILIQIDAGQFTEYDDIIVSVLQTLGNYYNEVLANSVNTPTGSNVTVQSQQSVKVTFSMVLGSTVPGVPPVTVTTPVQPGAAFGVAGGFVITPEIAFDVETTAVYTGPVTTCFSVPSINDPTVFASLVVLHFENGTLVDRTSSRDFVSRTVCATTTSLSPFTVALKESGTPIISGLPAAGCTLWPPDNKLVQVATVSVAEQLYGLALFNVIGTSNEPSDPNNPDVVITGTGLQPRAVWLRAARLGSGSGRIYTLTATATDRRGHTTTMNAACTVPHDQGK